jgi:predicted CXXCH cytochrome family protein
MKLRLLAMSKLDSEVNRVFLRLVLAVGCGSAWQARGETLAPSSSPLAGSITGPGTCATSGCHGGASAIGRQYVIWSQRDVHSRAFATLTSARANRMGEALNIAHPAASATCTACHAPLQTVAPELLAAHARIEDGVTCASCHGAGEAWLRSHTRHDFTHEDRVAAGMRELRNLYGRANTCVACHQNIDPALVKVGKHPALIFELDGQAASEPKHWREPATWHGAQAWLVGQSVALREMSGALQRDPAAAELDAPRWAGLLWVLQRCELSDALPSLTGLAAEPSPPAFAASVPAADTAAQRAAALTWTDEMTKVLLKKLAATSPAFLDATVAQRVQAYRAERLVLALDRLLASLPAAQRPAAAGARLDALFKLAQSIPDFAPADFAHALAEFEKAL